MRARPRTDKQRQLAVRNRSNEQKIRDAERALAASKFVEKYNAPKTQAQLNQRSAAKRRAALHKPRRRR